MYKVSIEQIDIGQQEEVVIRCHEITDEVLSLMEKLRSSEAVLNGTLDGEVFRIDIKEIYYIESVDNKTFIYAQKNVYETKLKLYEITELAKDSKLFRCSKSMIVNIGKIRSFSSAFNGRMEARLSNGETVIVSRQYVPELKKKLGM